MTVRTVEASAATAAESFVPATIAVVDSHTEGEPTRVLTGDWPRLEGASMVERRDRFRQRFDHIRRAAVCEPRGHGALVGALLTPPVASGSAAGAIFFNNVGYLDMCGHGLIGVVRTLEFVRRLEPGEVRIDTPAGTVRAVLEADGAVTLHSVACQVHACDIAVRVPGIGQVVGDIAYGGNWFFLARLKEWSVAFEHVDALMRLTGRIARALREQGISGAGGAEIDHILLSGPPTRDDADGKNFVLCPGGAYDRSPCGTGTAAKMACLHARGELALGQEWRQESVTGSLFTGWLTEGDEGDLPEDREQAPGTADVIAGRGLIPHIRGRAFVTGEATLRFHPEDPFRTGLGAA